MRDEQTTNDLILTHTETRRHQGEIRKESNEDKEEAAAAFLQASEHFTQMTDARKADRDFLAQVDSECKYQKKEHEKNKVLANDEEAAIDAAIKGLDGVSEQHDSATGRGDFAEQKYSFLQLSTEARQDRAAAGVVRKLRQEAIEMGSSRLMFLTTFKVNHGDPFVKVSDNSRDG